MLSTGLREEEALELADRLMDVISQPYHVGELEIKIGTCVGVAISEGEPDTEELFKHADLALYEAKALGPAMRAYSNRRCRRVCGRRSHLKPIFRRHWRMVKWKFTISRRPAP